MEIQIKYVGPCLFSSCFPIFTGKKVRFSFTFLVFISSEVFPYLTLLLLESQTAINFQQPSTFSATLKLRKQKNL